MAENTVNVKFTSDLTELQSGIQRAQGQMSSFGKEGASALAGLSKAMIAVAVAFAGSKAVNMFAEWETGLLNIASDIGELREKELPKFEDGLKNLAITSGVALPQLEEGLADIAHRGIEVGNELEALNQSVMLSVNTQSSLTTALNTTDIIMKQLGASAGTFAEVSGKVYAISKAGVKDIGELGTFMRRVGTSAQQAGVDIENLGAVTAFLTEKQIPQRQATTALVQVMGALSNMSAEKIALLKAEGVEIDNNSLKNEGLINVLGKLETLSAEAKKRILPEIENKNVLNLLTKSQIELQTKYNEIVSESGKMSTEYAKRQESVAQQMKQLNEAFRVLTIEAIGPFIPYLKMAVEQIIKAIGFIREWVSANQENIKALQSLINDGLAIVGPAIMKFVEFVGMAIQNTMDFVGANKQLIIEFGTNMVNAIKRVWEWYMKLNPVLDFIIKGVGKLIGEAYEGQKAWYEMNRAIEGTVQVYDNTVKAIDDLILAKNNLSKADVELLNAVKDQIKEQENHYIALQKSNTATEEQIQVAGQALQVTNDMATGILEEMKAKTASVEKTKEQTIALEEESEAQAEATEKLKAKDLEQKKEIAQIDVLVEQYRKLQTEYQNNKIGTDQYKQGIQDIVDAGTKITGSSDIIIAKLKEINQTDTTIDIKIRLEGEETLNEIQERILRLQEDLVIARLTGEAQKQKSIEVTEARALRALNNEMGAETMRHNQRILNIDLELRKDLDNKVAMAEAEKVSVEEYITLRKKRAEESTKVEAEFWAKIQTGLKTLAELEKDQAGNAKLSDEERLKRSREIEGSIRSRTSALEQEARAEESVANASMNRVVQGGAGSTIDMTGFQPGRVTTIQGGLGGSLISTMTPWASFAEGTDFVPATGIYQLHRGERVVPSVENKSGSESPMTIVNLIDPKMIPQILAQYPNAVLNIVNSDILRNGITRRVVKKVK